MTAPRRVRVALAVLVLAGCAPAPSPPQWAVTCLYGTRDTVAGHLRPVDRRIEVFTNDGGIRTVASYPASLCRATLTLDPPTGGDDGK